MLKRVKSGGITMLNKYSSWLYVLTVLFSSTSSSMYIIALTWILYETSGNAFYSGLIVGIGFIPGLLVNLFSGVIIDRLNKKNYHYFFINSEFNDFISDNLYCYQLISCLDNNYISRNSPIVEFNY